MAKTKWAMVLTGKKRILVDIHNHPYIVPKGKALYRYRIYNACVANVIPPCVALRLCADQCFPPCIKNRLTGTVYTKPNAPGAPTCENFCPTVCIAPAAIGRCWIVLGAAAFNEKCSPCGVGGFDLVYDKTKCKCSNSSSSSSPSSSGSGSSSPDSPCNPTGCPPCIQVREAITNDTGFPPHPTQADSFRECGYEHGDPFSPYTFGDGTGVGIDLQMDTSTAPICCWKLNMQLFGTDGFLHYVTYKKCSGLGPTGAYIIDTVDPLITYSVPSMVHVDGCSSGSSGGGAFLKRSKGKKAKARKQKRVNPFFPRI